MANTTVTDWPDDEGLLAWADDHASIASVARARGVKPTTLVNQLQNRGLSEAFKKRLTKRELSVVPEPSLEDEVSEVEILRARVKELERTNRARRKVDVFEERALIAIAEAIEARKPTYSPRVIPKSKRSSSQHEFVLLWSDTHAGEIVSATETNGINEYDWRIMLKRHDKIRESVFSYADNRPYPVSKLHVCAIGDMLSGSIHEELMVTNEVPLAEATVQFGIDGATFVESLLERFETIDFTGVIGNHPRATKQQAAKHAFDNADWLVYHAIKAHLRNQPAINFDIPKAGAHPITVAEKWRCLLLHGHGIRSSMPGVPWGGVVRRVTALDQQYAAKGMPIDHYFLGHFHQANAVLQGRVLMNGSVKGPDEYSLQAFGGGSEPCQLLLTFHPRNGLTDVSLIDCV